MKLIFKTIELNQQSYNVALLHKVLAALELPVSKTDLSKSKAGKSTLKQVRALQARLGINVSANDILLDEESAAAIVKEMSDRGLVSASRSFSVSGSLNHTDGKIVKNQQLIAFDLDLRGVGVYRDLKSLKEAKENGGFEYLGKAVSDNKGQYSIHFYDWQYQRAERKLADVVVYALNDKDEIIGHSRLVNTEDYDKGFVRGLDIIVSRQDERTEYQVLMDPLSNFLRESNSSLKDIAESGDQIAFTARELDLDLDQLRLAVVAEVVVRGEAKLGGRTHEQSHELLYGIGRQGISLSWAVLYKKKQAELIEAIAQSVKGGIIAEFYEDKVKRFVRSIEEYSISHLLNDKDEDGHNALTEILGNALPEESQHSDFLSALREFDGLDYRAFWEEQLPRKPAFENRPELIEALQLSQQFTALVGNHQALVKELQVEKEITTAESLLDFTHDDWLETLEKTGVPEFVEGKDDEEKRQRYAEGLESRLNANFPTQRIARMGAKQLGIKDTAVAAGVKSVLALPDFDLRQSRIHDFEKIEELANGEAKQVRAELMKIQRVFQVSTTPAVMTALIKKNLHSAYSIASIPRANFIKTHSEALGGSEQARAAHQRAEFINTRVESVATDVQAYAGDPAMPAMVMSSAGVADANAILIKKFSNYSKLFGSPDLCECQHCRSINSPAAYFVDLLRFLERSTYHLGEQIDANKRSPYDYLVGKKDEDSGLEIPGRRPDLAELALSCENTNTLIPYVDLSNEVMEHYVAQDSLSSFGGHNTGDATADELRANPQHQYDVTAYKKLAQAKHPFSLPFHQPLDEIRTYGDHLGVSRYEVMQAVNPQPADDTPKAIAAEALQISLEEYTAVTGEILDGASDPTPLHEFYGFDSAEIAVDPLAPIGGATISVLETLSPVHEFMARSGVKYIELVELVKTKFINPHQDKLDFLDRIFSHRLESPEVLYSWLESVSTNQASESEDVITTALEDYNSIQENEESQYTRSELVNWAGTHFEDVKNILTLFEPDSKCNLDTTRLRTLQSVHEEANTIVVMINGQEEERPGPSGVTNNNWSLFHRFIRLWRKLGWSIHETDLILTALGENGIRPETITKLEAVLQLKKASKRPLDQLAVLWGNIDTYGQRSLYKKLFLNKAIQQIEPVFMADAEGGYFTDTNAKLIDHQSAILAAFRITEEEWSAIIDRASIDPDDADLDLANLSTIYRYVVLARALKVGVADLCKLIEIFDPNPFGSAANPGTPAETYAFYQLAASVKKARFKPVVLDYIFNGELSNDSKLGMEKNKVLQAAKTTRGELAVIELDHPEIGDSDPALTSEFIASKLMLCFQPEIVGRFIEVVENTASFHTITEPNLVVTIPDALAGKYSYTRSNGRLIGVGVMSEAEQSTLKGLANADTNFKAAVDELYAAPETFLSDHFNSLFTDLAVAEAQADGTDITTAKTEAETKAREVLLDHPHGTVASLEDRLSFVYKHYLPALKRKLRKGVLTNRLADLTGLSEAATAMLIADDSEALLGKLTIPGFSASYFNETDISNPDLVPSMTRVDDKVDFSWGSDSPKIDNVTADNFSVRWRSYLSAPQSDEYTLVVEVAEADEAFKLYLDGTLILEKLKNTAVTKLEVIANLNTAQMHQVTLEYTEFTDFAGIHLRWKTATTGLEIIPSSTAYPADQLDEFFDFAEEVHRAARLITGFKLDETELSRFIKFSGEFDAINFKALTAIHWERIHDYVTLRNSVPQAEALVTDVFALASRSNPEPDMPGIKKLILQSTAWDENSLTFLEGHFSLGTNDFKDEIFLNRILKIMQISAKTGLSAETIATWGDAKADLETEARFEQLHETAQSLKNSVKSKYNDTEWLDLAGNLSDKIREKKKQALIAYLLGQESIRKADVSDADGLFEYFLIDVQMGACMDTSRIVQANAAIQLFVNRVLLNLETNIPPDAIDPERWSWMKNYRVWEANRKVFLHPENWLEPEWRNDRSEFFKELESHLLQNDITARSVEQGLRNYLMSLNEVANLDICGMHQENYKDGKRKYLHVFGRTHNLPYKYFYRRWDEFEKWSAWKKVQVDIRSVEDGENSGVHLIPVVWKGRLFLFWPEFMEKAKSVGGVQLKAGMNSSKLEPEKYWEIRLAWSEHVDESWSPKQVTKEFVRTDGGVPVVSEPPLRIKDDSEVFFRTMARMEAPNTGGGQGGSGIGGDNEEEARPVNSRCPELLPSEIRVIPSFHSGNLHIAIHADHFYITPHREATAVQLFQEPLGGPFTYPKFIFSDIQSRIKVEGNIACKPKVSGARYKNAYSKQTTVGSRLIFSSNVYLKYTSEHQLLGANGVRETTVNLADRKPFFYSDAHRTYFTVPRDRPKIFDLRGSAVMSDPQILLAKKSDNQTQPSGDERDSNVITHASVAFGGISYSQAVAQTAKRLEFHTFHHPLSSDFITRLNQGGIQALMGSDTEDADIHDPPLQDPIKSDKGGVFKSNYDPDFNHVRPRINNLTEQRTYYQENVCFDALGANSLYNWELFFHAPLYIATRLSKNGKYEEAMKWFHHIFDPTTNEAADTENENTRFWKVRPLKAESKTNDTLEEWFRKLEPNPDPENSGNSAIKEWRNNPFDPHLVASNRPIAYMKQVVIKYVENLIDWGDSLFRQFTRESVYEAIQLYVIASHVLGKRPEFVPKRGKIKTETYASIKDKLDDFGNALIELENILPYSSEVNVTENSPGTSLLGIGSALYFCIPANDKLLESWDTVEDRLFKIRHCQDLEGVERDLALFAPPIDPAALIQARAQGLSLGDILDNLNSPLPIYRFGFLLQKANEFCNDVKALGSALLSAIEKKDGEELGRLRASQEINMLERVTGIRERQILAAKSGKENLLKVRETAKLRLQHYKDLLGDDLGEPTDAPTLDASPTRLPGDTSIPMLESDVDMSLADSDESGVKIIPRENEQLSKNDSAKLFTASANATEILAGIAAFIPSVDVFGAPLGVGTKVNGPNWTYAVHLAATAARGYGAYNSAEASQASIMSGFIRRTHDWTLQANLAIREIIQLDKQITSADIQIQISEKELQSHQQQIENSKQTELFLKDKFTNQELYQWMKEQLFSVYKQSYNLAFEMAKKAEKACQYELGTESTGYIQYGYWDNATQGLVSGEKLQLALRQLENSYLDQNKRTLELRKTISLAMLNPLALIELREAGKCQVSLPEELFDLDFQGHYCRRIKSVSLSIPCITGPNTSVNCTLRLIKNSTRINTSMSSNEGIYEHEHEEGFLIDDDRFRQQHVPVTSIATSNAQNDSGLFEFNFRDERYLPFEGSGVISQWELELSDPELQQFDYTSISDVMLHLNYTAKEAGGTFKDEAINYIKRYMENATAQTDQPLVQLLSMKDEFPTEWHKFLRPESEGDEQVLKVTVGKERFPFFIQDRLIEVAKIDILAKCSQPGNYHVILSYANFNGNIVTSPEVLPNLITMPVDSSYGGLNKVTINEDDTGLDLNKLDISGEMTLRIKSGGAPDFTSLSTNPDEVEDLFLVIHYQLKEIE